MAGRGKDIRLSLEYGIRPIWIHLAFAQKMGREFACRLMRR